MKLLLTSLLSASSAQNNLIAPMTGDINIMIIAAVILIAAFLIFVLLRKGRNRD
jgi:LPXTG-motif cell wall-anchored protein